MKNLVLIFFFMNLLFLEIGCKGWSVPDDDNGGTSTYSAKLRIESAEEYFYGYPSGWDTNTCDCSPCVTMTNSPGSCSAFYSPNWFFYQPICNMMFNNYFGWSFGELHEFNKHYVQIIVSGKNGYEKVKEIVSNPPNTYPTCMVDIEVPADQWFQISVVWIEPCCNKKRMNWETLPNNKPFYPGAEGNGGEYNARIDYTGYKQDKYCP